MINEEFQNLLLTKLNNIEQGQKNLEKRQQNIEIRLDNLDKRQQNLEARLDNLDKRQEKLEARLDNLEKRQQNFEAGQKALARKLDIVYKQTAFLTEFRTEANMKLDSIIEENKSIHEILGEHEVSIRTLRRKPV